MALSANDPALANKIQVMCKLNNKRQRSTEEHKVSVTKSKQVQKKLKTDRKSKLASEFVKNNALLVTFLNRSAHRLANSRQLNVTR